LCLRRFDNINSYCSRRAEIFQFIHFSKPTIEFSLNFDVIGPGCNKITLIFVSRISRRSVSVKPSSAYLVATYEPLQRIGIKPNTLEQFIMRPCFCDLIIGITLIMRSCHSKCALKHIFYQVA
jgi:hypothetical protein